MARDDAVPPERGRILRRGATRVLFAVSALFAPVPFSLWFSAGFVPYALTFVVGSSVMVGMLVTPGFESEGIVPGMIALNLAIGGGLLYLVCAIVCRMLFAFCPPRIATRGLAVLLVGEALASLCPIYWLPISETDTSTVNMVGLIGRLLAR
jgi:hypothetical protein